MALFAVGFFAHNSRLPKGSLGGVLFQIEKVKADTQAEAIVQALEFIHKQYPTDQGWGYHRVLIQQLKEPYRGLHMAMMIAFGIDFSPTIAITAIRASDPLQAHQKAIDIIMQQRPTTQGWHDHHAKIVPVLDTQLAN